MSDVIVKSELAEDDDEENGRATPKRQSVYDYEETTEPGTCIYTRLSHATVQMDHNVTESNTNSVEMARPCISNANVAMQTSSTEDSSNCIAPSVTEQQQNDASIEALKTLLASSISTSGVLVKEEPQDVAVIENSKFGLGSQQSTINNEAEEAPPPQTSSITSPSATNLETNPDRSPPVTADSVVISEVQNSVLESDTSYAPCTVKSVTENDTNPKQLQISVVPTHRLRVKTELSEIATPSNHDSSVLPQDFFEDLMPENAPSPPTIKDEPLPDNFFDDLLVDRVKERVEAAETMELEEKFSDRLNELRELEHKQRAKDKKKHKKSKKKSRKRSRSRSRSRGRDCRSPTAKQVRKNERTREDISDLPSTSNRARSNTSSYIEDDSMENVTAMLDDNDQPQINAISAADNELVYDTENIETMQPHLPEIGPHLTVKQKRERIMIRAKSLIAYLKRVENAEERPISTFLFTSAVRKLPASHSYRSQHIYENRSPLHTINNVSYKFNSHISQFNFEEWGLASLPPLSAKIAKLIGYDAEAVHNKLKTTKIPAKIRNIKSEGQDAEDEELPQYRSSLFRNVTTQTDEMVEISPLKSRGYDIGVQVQSATFEIACQTLETNSPSIKPFDNSDDLPIMAIMRELNENQLMALHDFAELLKEPAINAMDMYRLRQRMLDIYKCSQLPSALASPVPSSGNSYTSNFTNFTEYENMGAAANNTATRNAGPPVLQSNDPRNPLFRSHQTHQQHPQQPHSQPPANNGRKYYGRGGFRR